MTPTQYDELDKLAGEVIAAFRDDREADVSNLIDAGLIDAKGLAYALARHAAALRFIAPDGQAFHAQRDATCSASGRMGTQIAGRRRSASSWARRWDQRSATR